MQKIALVLTPSSPIANQHHDGARGKMYSFIQSYYLILLVCCLTAHQHYLGY